MTSKFALINTNTQELLWFGDKIEDLRETAADDESGDELSVFTFTHTIVVERTITFVEEGSQ